MGQVTPDCEILANQLKPSVSHINNDPTKGLQLVYSGGGQCLDYDKMVQNPGAQPQQR